MEAAIFELNDRRLVMSLGFRFQSVRVHSETTRVDARGHFKFGGVSGGGGCLCLLT